MYRDDAKDMLFTIFGLCPDYKVVLVEGEWVEYYESPTDIFKYMPTYDYHEPEYKKELDKVFYPNKTRLHLNVHTVEDETGVFITATFAVSHENKIIFLKVTPVGEIARMEKKIND